MKKRILISFFILIILAISYIVLANIFSPEYSPSDDEMALHIQLDTKEDVGLIVFDYSADNHTYSGGISNADKTMIKRDSENIQVWTKEELDSTSESVEMSITFKIITEYLDPNFENVYPEELTKEIGQISWEAYFGESYFVTITGDKDTGYEVVLNQYS